LKNLNPEDLAKMTRALLKKELPDSWIRELFDRTQGNPGFLTETCREILSADLLKKKHLPSSLIRNLDLPMDLSHLLKTRWDRLPEEEKEIFTWTATAFQGATAEELQVLTGKPRLEISAGLERMGDWGLLRGAGEGRYAPAHGAASQWALDSRSSADRARFHSDWLKRKGEEDLLARAHHALEIPGHEKKFQWALEGAEAFFFRPDYPAVAGATERALLLNHEKE